MAARFEDQRCVCADIDRDDREVVSIVIRAWDAIGHFLSSSIEVRPLFSKSAEATPLSAAISCWLISSIAGNSSNSSIGIHSTAISLGVRNVGQSRSAARLEVVFDFV